jgi:hypothetical protein
VWWQNNGVMHNLMLWQTEGRVQSIQDDYQSGFAGASETEMGSWNLFGYDKDVSGSVLFKEALAPARNNTQK